jgi:uncharacterized protein YbjQ (UPF0145 family)
MSIVTGLSGNEIYCIDRLGMAPGDLVIGNSVFSMGFIGSIASAARTLAGGEVTQVTQVIHDGRKLALDRLLQESKQRAGSAVTGVTSELLWHGGNVEFLSVGSSLKHDQHDELGEFSTSAGGQELFCQIDAGFRPIHFAFGNVAYSIGVAGGLGGFFQSFSRGEVTQYSEVFNKTRHLALERIEQEAKSYGANSVVGIRTSILPLMGTTEMLMIGTASRHPALGPEFDERPITSHLTCQEMWNLIRLGYMPIRLVLGVSVYALGLAGGISAMFRGLARGEINQLTTLIYDARENAILQIAKEADACGADEVVGIKTFISQLGQNMIEFMAVGTAAKKMEGLGTKSEQLPPQALVRDEDTVIKPSRAAGYVAKNLNTGN